MKTFGRSMLLVALTAVIALGIVASNSQAGQTSVGTFKLAFDVQVGSRTLPTGDYSLSFDRSEGPYGVIHLYRGTQSVGMILPQMLNSNERQGDKPVLIGIRHDGKVTVRALRLPRVGTLYFQLPKDLNTLVAQQPRLIETVSIQVSGE